MSHRQEAPNNAITSYKNAPTRTVSAGGVDFAYRELGQKTGFPLVLVTHLAAVLDNWDPRVVDGLAATRRVIAFDNRASAPPPARCRRAFRRWRKTRSPSSWRWA